MNILKRLRRVYAAARAAWDDQVHLVVTRMSQSELDAFKKLWEAAADASPPPQFLSYAEQVDAMRQEQEAGFCAHGTEVPYCLACYPHHSHFANVSPQSNVRPISTPFTRAKARALHAVTPPKESA